MNSIPLISRKSILTATAIFDATLLGLLSLFGPFLSVALLSAVTLMIFCLISPIGLPLILVAVSHIAEVGGMNGEYLRLAKWMLVMGFFAFTVLRLAIQEKSEIFTLSKFESYFLLFLGWASICSIFAIKPGGSITETARIASLFLVYFTCRRTVRSERELKLLLVTLLISVCIASLTAIAQIFLGISGRAQGLYQNANMLGVFLSFALPGLMIGYLLHRSILVKLVFGSGIALGVFAALLSWSRASYLSLAVQVLTYLIIERKKKVLGALASVTAILLIVIIANPTLRTIAFEGLRLQGGTTHRTSLWKHGIDAFVANPVFGVGFEAPKSEIAGKIMWNSFVDFMLYADPDSRFQPHNVYIYFLMSTGLLGFIILVLMMKELLAESIRNRARAPNDAYRKAHSVAFALLLGLIAHGFFESTGAFGHGSWANYLWVLIASVQVLAIKDGQETAPQIPDIR